MDDTGATAQAGVTATTQNAVLSDRHRISPRPKATELAKLCGLAAANYAAVIESCAKAHDAGQSQATD